MIDLIWQYFHMPGHGADSTAWLAWGLAAYAAASEFLGLSSKFKPDTVIGAIIGFVNGGIKAIKINAATGQVSVDVKALETDYVGTVAAYHGTGSVHAPVDQPTGPTGNDQPQDISNADPSGNG